MSGHIQGVWKSIMALEKSMHGWMIQFPQGTGVWGNENWRLKLPRNYQLELWPTECNAGEMRITRSKQTQCCKKRTPLSFVAEEVERELLHFEVYLGGRSCESFEALVYFGDEAFTPEELVPPTPEEVLFGY